MKRRARDRQEKREDKRPILKKLRASLLRLFRGSTATKLSVFCTSWVYVVVSTNPFVRCGLLAYQKELYVSLLSTVIDLSNL